MPPPRRRISPGSIGRRSIVVWIGFILIAALAIFMLTRPPAEGARPTTIGVSFNSFFRWIGELGPIVQIPIILLVFGSGRGHPAAADRIRPPARPFYFWLRLVACFVIPVLAFMLLRPYQNAVIYVLAIAVILGAILFCADYRARARARATSSSSIAVLGAGSRSCCSSA